MTLLSTRFLSSGCRNNVTSQRTRSIGSKPQNQHGNPWMSQMSSINTVRRGSTSSPPASTRTNSGSPELAMGHTAIRSSSVFSDALSALIASLNALSTTDNATYYSVCLFKIARRYKPPPPPSSSKRETVSPVFATPAFNSCQHALRAEKTDQLQEAFVPETIPIAETHLRRQKYPSLFHVARRNRWKFERPHKNRKRRTQLASPEFHCPTPH